MKHQKRLTAMVDKENENKRFEQLLTKDRFLDKLAEKISNKMSVAASLSAEPARGPGDVDHSREGWHAGHPYDRPQGDLTNYKTPSGNGMTSIRQPPQPNFIEDEALKRVEKNKLPKSLRGEFLSPYRLVIDRLCLTLKIACVLGG